MCAVSGIRKLELSNTAKEWTQHRLRKRSALELGWSAWPNAFQLSSAFTSNRHFESAFAAIFSVPAAILRLLSGCCNGGTATFRHIYSVVSYQRLYYHYYRISHQLIVKYINILWVVQCYYCGGGGAKPFSF